MALSKPLIVEFIGLAGSGKSYMHNIVSDLLKKKGVEVQNISGKSNLSLINKAFFKLMNTVFALYFVLIKYRIKSDKMKVMGLLKKRLRKFQSIMLKKGNGLYFFDEGIIQYAAISHYNRNNKLKLPDIFADLISYIGAKPRLVIGLESDPDTLKNRRITRNRLIEKTTDPEKIKIAHNQFRNLKNQLEDLFNQNNISYLFLDNSVNEIVELNARIICAEIINILNKEAANNPDSTTA